MQMVISEIISPALGPTMVAPKISSVPSRAEILTKPVLFFGYGMLKETVMAGCFFKRKKTLPPRWELKPLSAGSGRGMDFAFRGGQAMRRSEMRRALEWEAKFLLI